jgi:hypothetical protein
MGAAFQMKLFLSSLIIFFGTLLAAALVALGEPGQADLAILGAASDASTGSGSPRMHGPSQPVADPLVVARWLGLR